MSLANLLKQKKGKCLVTACKRYNTSPTSSSKCDKRYKPRRECILWDIDPEILELNEMRKLLSTTASKYEDIEKQLKKKSYYTKNTYCKELKGKVSALAKANNTLLEQNKKLQSQCLELRKGGVEKSRQILARPSEKSKRENGRY